MLPLPGSGDLLARRAFVARGQVSPAPRSPSQGPKGAFGRVCLPGFVYPGMYEQHDQVWYPSTPVFVHLRRHGMDLSVRLVGCIHGYDKYIQVWCLGTPDYVQHVP